MGKKDTVEDYSEPAVYDISREAEQRIHDLEQQLQFTRENLQATIEELETSNEELQATNEELLASNEELQSTNEELQSVNEELHTVNAEHHRKIVELTELNNDLENMHAGARVGMLFLDENLELRRYTPQISKVFNLLEADIGRPFDHLSHRLADVPVGDLVRRVQKSNETVEQEVLSEQGIWYQMRILPYRVAPQTYSGVVLCFSDIHLLKTAQAALEVIQQEHTLTQHTTNVGTWSMNIETGACQWSDTMATLLGLGSDGLGARIEDYLAATHVEDRERVAKAVQASRQSRLPLDMEHRVSRPDGNLRWLAIKGVVTRNPGEKEARLFCVVKDVSDRLHIVDVERRLETIACGLADVILVHDFEGQIRAWNHEAEQIYGWRLEESIGMSVERLIPTAHRKGYLEIIQRVAQGKAIEGVKTCRMTKSGREIEVWLKAAPILDRQGRPEAVAVTERVISKLPETVVQ
jgi:two-component system CheB/CheR fusion protein